MAKKSSKKTNLAETKDDKDKEVRREEILLYIKLVDGVRKSKNKVEEDLNFGEIVELLDPRIKKVSNRFDRLTPGVSSADVYQEALYALRYKAIKDYDQSRCNHSDISPFDHFAMMCITRHLSTKLKASFQNRSKILNLSVSLNQDQNNNEDSNLYLCDIVTDDEEDVLHCLTKNEYNRKLLVNLFKKLSKFEKQVFVHYAHGDSYSDIAKKIIKTMSRNEKDKFIFGKIVCDIDVIRHGGDLEEDSPLLRFKTKIKRTKKDSSILVHELIKTISLREKRILEQHKMVKSVDNALSRVKTKAKSVYKNLG